MFDGVRERPRPASAAAFSSTPISTVSFAAPTNLTPRSCRSIPGNGGLAAGCALARAVELGERTSHGSVASSCLGPFYSHEEIKAVVDNCKLAYESWTSRAWLHAPWMRCRVDNSWAASLAEWNGERERLATGGIFANPFSPYVLDTLNGFLKHRRPYRGYGMAVREEDAAGLFDGPAVSPFMECEYRPRDVDRFAHVLPKGVVTTRVQTVGDEPSMLRELLHAFGESSGSPVLVNTSFNGFHEPIVCSPRDAVRVFFGSGLDCSCSAFRAPEMMA